jgi:hypothetical protein
MSGTSNTKGKAMAEPGGVDWLRKLALAPVAAVLLLSAMAAIVAAVAFLAVFLPLAYLFARARLFLFNRTHKVLGPAKSAEFEEYR